MFDSVFAPSLVAGWVAIATLVLTFASVLVAGWLAITNRPLNRVVHSLFIVTQLALMGQMLLAIVSVSQGTAVAESWLYYGSGLVALILFSLFYWLPQQLKENKTQYATGLAVLLFLLAMTTLTVGSHPTAVAAPQNKTIIPIYVSNDTAENVPAIEKEKDTPSEVCFPCELDTVEVEAANEQLPGADWPQSSSSLPQPAC